jgi:hypothetical protein
MSRELAAIAALACAAAASAQNWSWSNVEKYPDDLVETGDAWSAIRIEEPAFVSYRVAADDFALEAETRITRITFYSVHIDPPNIIGGDWYIYEDDGRGEPGRLLAAGPDTRLDQHPLRIINNVFGSMIYGNVMEPRDLVLPAGRYFLAFRTYQGEPLGGGKPNNVALTTRRAIAGHPAMWNFGVLADGTATQAWVPMQVFNLVQEQEWAFQLEGEQDGCYADCDGNGVLDFFDFLCFQNLFLAADPRGDCDRNGVFDFFDFLCFQNAFLVGCP